MACWWKDPDPDPDPYKYLRIRIPEARKIMDPPDPDPEHWPYSNDYIAIGIIAIEIMKVSKVQFFRSDDLDPTGYSTVPVPITSMWVRIQKSQTVSPKKDNNMEI